MSREIIPTDLFHLPGFLGEVMRLMLDTAPRPNPVLAFGGALSLLAHIAGGKIANERKRCTNLYLTMIGPAGEGRTHPANVIRHILDDRGQSNTYFEAFASQREIEETLYRRPVALCLTENIRPYLIGTAHGEEARKRLVADSMVDAHALAGRQYRGKYVAMPIDGPCLNLLTVMSPDDVDAVLRRSGARNRLLSRMLFLPLSASKHNTNPARISVPRVIRNTVAYWGKASPARAEVMATREADAVLADWYEEIDARLAHLDDNAEDIAPDSLWAHAYAHAEKLAMLHAVSANHKCRVVRAIDARWAVALTRRVTEHMARLVNATCA